MFARSILPISVAILSALSTGCVTTQKAPEPAPKPAPQSPAEVKRTVSWNAEGASGPASIVVDLGDQRAYFYKGEKLVGETNISSGKKGFETPTGQYKVTQKDKDHVSNLYGDFVNEAGEVIKKNVDVSKEKVPEGATFAGSKMPYFLRFTGGYGLHAGRLPGRPASHGCVRLPREMARHFYENSITGTPVLVRD